MTIMEEAWFPCVKVDKRGAEDGSFMGGWLWCEGLKELAEDVGKGGEEAP